MVIVAACKISFCITKSGNSTKSLHGVKQSIHQKEEHVMFFYCFAKFEVIIPGERMTVSAIFQAVISEYEHKWLTVSWNIAAFKKKISMRVHAGSQSYIKKSAYSWSEWCDLTFF